MTIKDIFLRRNGWCWPLLGTAKLFSNWMPKARKPSWEAEPSVPHLSLRAVVGCPVHCCRLSLGTSIPNLNSVISVRCGVIVSVCWWDAWSNNYLNSPSGLVSKGTVPTTAVDVLTVHCQSLHAVINALLHTTWCAFHVCGAFYAFITLLSPFYQSRLGSSFIA